MQYLSSFVKLGLLALMLSPTPLAWAAPPSVGSIAPSSGSSAPGQWVSFTATYSDPNGWKNLKEVRLLVNTSTSGKNSLYVRYVRSSNKLYLRDDANRKWLGGLTPGTATVLMNSQGQLDVAGTTVSGTGNVLTVTWKVAFKSTFAGRTYNTYLWAKDNSKSTGLIQRGTWTVTAPDGTPPTTPVVTDDGTFTTSTTQLHATWTSSDPESGIAEYQYAIGTTAGGTDIVTWTSTGTTASVTKTGLSLTNGKAYYFSVKSLNGASLWSSVGVSDGIVVDGTAPTTPVVTDDGSFTSSTTQLHATWTSSDPESGIVEYQYQITQGSPTGTVVVAWTSTGTTASVTQTGLSLVNGASYYFSVKARNGANTWSAIGSSDGITVDSTAPTTPVVTDDGAFTTSTTQLHATWVSSDPESSIADYQYAIGTTAGGTDLVNWTSTGTTASVTKTGLSLTNGTTYYFSVKTRNGAGTWSSIGSSDGITVDSTAPTTPVVTDDGAYTTSNNQLHVTWTSSDPESGMSQFQYAIGTTSGGTDVLNWTPINVSPNITEVKLTILAIPLINGKTYYFSVKARNGANLWSSVGLSDGITVDSTAPTTPVITDDGTFTSSTTQLHATWTSSDPESGIAQYQYKITQDSPTGTLVVDWTSTGTTASVTKTGLSLTNGKAYYFSVKSLNGAGLWSAVGSSDGITVQVGDTTPPTTPVVTDDGAFTTSTTQLHATWTSTDPESGIADYQYRITQDSATGTLVVDWTSTGTTASVTKTGLTLTNGKAYYFSVKSLNGAGLWSAIGSSDGIVVDKNAPIISGLTPADGTAFTEKDLVTITVTASDADGDPLEYQFLVDGVVARAWSSSKAFTWDTTGKIKLDTIIAQVRDGLGRQTEAQVKLFGYRRPVPPPS